MKDGEAVKYIFGNNIRIAQVQGSKKYFFHKDHLGSSTVMSNVIGVTAESTEYMPFGKTRVHTGTDLSDYKFTDQELDKSTGFYNYDARLYDPVIGRFVIADSIVPDWYDPQSLNRYAYCLNNPLVYVDPTGHWVADWAHAWDSSANETSSWLDSLVYDHTWTWPIAATVQTCMDVGGGFVDILKFGEGSAEAYYDSDYWGIGKDFLRGFSIASFSGGALSKSLSTFSKTSKSGIELSRQLGWEGEAISGIKGPKIRISSKTETAAYRIPDELTAEVLKEAKNVMRLRWTNQLTDFGEYASKNNLRFVIDVRKNTSIGPKAQQMIDKYVIDVNRLYPAR